MKKDKKDKKPTLKKRVKALETEVVTLRGYVAAHQQLIDESQRHPADIGG